MNRTAVALCRASTSLGTCQMEDVDGRDAGHEDGASRLSPGHDEEERPARFRWSRAAQAGLAFRPMTDADLPFLASLYASTRMEELSVTDWSGAQKAAFLQMQFDAQHAHYQKHYQGSDFLIIEHAGQPIGRTLSRALARRASHRRHRARARASRSRARNGAAYRPPRRGGSRRQGRDDPRGEVQSRHVALSPPGFCRGRRGRRLRPDALAARK